MSDLQNLYQELILDHSRTPHGYGLRDEIPAQSHQLNPTCGDEITLQVHRDVDGSVESIAPATPSITASTSASVVYR